MKGGGRFRQVLPHLLQLCIQGRIIRFPELLPRLYPVPVNAGSFSVEEKAVSLHLPDAAPLFFIPVFPCINDKAVSGRERHLSFRPDVQPALAAVHNDARISAALFAVASMGQARVVRAVQPACGKAA